jgi:murein DD-endopeptidase MepM/ murein hydrolase activator NlpD
VAGLITSGYGYRASPFGRGRDLHEGLDIAAPYGSPVITTGDGKITFVGWRASYGKSVVIDHGFGFTTLYGHNSRITVTVGQSVKKRQIIAYVGTSGRSTGPHLHYEVRLNGRLVDPRRYLSHATF